MQIAATRPSPELLEQAQTGDARAFGQLISPYLPSLRRFAFSFAEDRSEADDLTQEALLKAFRSFRNFQCRSQISTWLYVIVRSVGQDLHRAKSRRERPLGTLEPADELSEERSAEEQLSAHDDSQELWRAIKRLEPDYRIALVLYEIEGLSYEEVAALVRVPVGTIRSRLSRARSALRGLLLQSTLISRGSGSRSAAV